MLMKLLLALCLVACCVTVHASGVTWALRRLRSRSRRNDTFWNVTWLCVRLAAWMILCHLVEIGAWGVVYILGGAIPDAQSAFYFSAVTYTTTGYGDVLLPPEWRLLGGVEALTGILMCGWSAAFFFEVLNLIYARPVR